MTRNEIEAIQKKLGVSRRELAGLLGTRYETLSRWISGDQQPSQVYQHKLRELVGQTGQRRAQEHWIFWNANVDRIRNIAVQSGRLVLGTVRAPHDPTGQFVVATIRLQRNASRIRDLLDCWRDEVELGIRSMSLVACFFADTGLVRPIGGMREIIIRSGYAVLLDTSTSELNVWAKKAPFPLESGTNEFRPVPYVVIGGAHTS